MIEAEVRRRVAAIIAMAPDKRPIAVSRLAHIAGLSVPALRDMGKQAGILPTTRKRLARALTWLENDQVVVRKRAGKLAEVTIRAPQPPQENLTRVVVDKRTGRPRVEFLAVNPNAFPHRTKLT